MQFQDSCYHSAAHPFIELPMTENQTPTTENPNDTGLPLRWPAIYSFVLAWFILLVVALTIFTRYYTK
jgi:hypothetical protein